ncbi:hypothetical protein ACFL5A_00225 [Gemmatimonadota bacterium]
MFSKIDADRILKRAAEIEGLEDTKPLTVAELRSIAGEAGFGSHAVERAIAEAKRAAQSEVHRPPVQRSGVVFIHLSTVRSMPLEVSSEQLMRAVRLFQPYRDGPAQVKLEEHQITWRDRKGIRFTVTSAGGATEISVYVSKLLFRRGRWMGWVKAAADRLETFVFMEAAQDPSGSQLLAELPGSKGSAAESNPSSGGP